MVERNALWPRATAVPEAVPEPGDIVISPFDGFPGHYALSVRPGPAQFVCVTYQEALARARRFARRARVDVWVEEDTRRVALVARHRADVRTHLH